MKTRKKQRVPPTVEVSHNQSNTGLEISVLLSGADKETVDLDMGNNGFCVKAEGKEVWYDCCIPLGHEILPLAAHAIFDSGALTIEVPFKETVRGHKIAVG
jgi:HSP20 family protein